jgi:probable HAF family extracellular repeat protein
MVMKRWVFWLQAFILAGIIGLAGNLEAAAPKYYYFTTGLPGSEALAVNDNNQAVVDWNDRAYLWTLSEGLLDLGDLGGGKSGGFAINNSGQIVGESYIDATTSHPFLWDPQTKAMTDLVTDPSPLNGGVRNIAGSINNSGKVVGVSLDDKDQLVAAWTWTLAGGLQPLDLQGSSAFAFKIKDDGRMVGTKNGHAWLWTTPGAGQDLGTLAAPYNGTAQACDINKKGQVVGLCVSAKPS